MKIWGIVSEFNPFHNGHKLLIDSIRREKSVDAVVCIMSGNFVQRGKPALLDKFDRAETAIYGGADLVIELPFCYAVNGAGEFAKGGVRILKGIGAEGIAFGSESGNADSIKKAASLFVKEDSLFSEALMENLSLGFSYPKSFQLAAEKAGYDPSLFDGPNNTLAIEYLKQAALMEKEFDVFTIKRIGSYNSLSEEKGYMSASAVRSILEKEKDKDALQEKLQNTVPIKSFEKLTECKLYSAEDEERLYTVIKHLLLTSSSQQLKEVLEVGEGLENKLKKEVIYSHSLDELIHKTKSKRYTYSRISRILMQLAAGLTKEDYRQMDEAQACYARILAFNNCGRKAIKYITEEGTIPVFTNLNKIQKDESDPVLQLLKYDILSTDLYSNFTGRNIYEGSDLTCNPRFVNI